MQMLKADAEREAIRRWYLLPEFERQTCEHCESYAARLVHDLEFYTVTSRQRLIGAWLMREMFRAKEQAKAEALELEDALAEQAARAA